MVHSVSSDWQISEGDGCAHTYVHFPFKDTQLTVFSALLGILAGSKIGTYLIVFNLASDWLIQKNVLCDGLRCPALRIKYFEFIHLVPMLLFLFSCEGKYNI